LTWPHELQLLYDTGWLAETPESFRQAVLDRCVVKKFGRGEAIYHPSDPPGGLYGFVAGGIGVEVMPEDRESYLGLFVLPGFWIGEVSVLTRKSRAVGLRATRDSVLAHLPLAQWDVIASTDNDAWRWFAHLPLRNELLLVAFADALLIPRASARLAAMLLVLCSSGGKPHDRSAEPLDISQEDLARITNLSRSSAGRILKAFESERLIDYHYRQLRIIDLEGLRRHRAER
jgi:CRP-like cAMP-binding protein